MADRDGDKIYNDIVEKIESGTEITKQDIILSGKDLEKVKEELRMTELGKSLIQEGIEKGREEGKAELLIKMLMKKFKKVPSEYKEKIKSLPEESLELIATDIFEINSIEELEQYF